VDAVTSNCVINLVPDKGLVFREVARVLRPGGRYAFSIEQPSQDCGSYRLEQSGRYAHSLAYVRRLALEHGLAERVCLDVAIRKHGAQVLPGQLLVLHKSPD